MRTFLKYAAVFCGGWSIIFSVVTIEAFAKQNWTGAGMLGGASLSFFCLSAVLTFVLIMTKEKANGEGHIAHAPAPTPGHR